MIVVNGKTSDRELDPQNSSSCEEAMVRPKNVLYQNICNGIAISVDMRSGIEAMNQGILNKCFSSKGSLD